MNNILIRLTRALVIIAIVSAAGVCGVLLHELGHLIMGKLTGYRFVSFRVGSIVLTGKNGRLRLRRYSIPGTFGQCIMTPSADVPPEKHPAVLYHLGGGLFNILTAAAALPAGLLLAENKLTKAFLIMLGAISAGQALLNLIPVKLRVPNDGYNIRLILRSPSDRTAIYNILRAQGMPDLSLAEMPPELFAYSEEGEYSRVSMLMLGSRLLDQHDLAGAEEIFAKCAVSDGKSMDLYRLEAKSELLFCALMRGASGEEIAALYDAELKDYIESSKKTQLSKARLMYAYHRLFSMDGAQAGRESALFERLCRTHPSAGEARSERSLMEAVEQRAKQC